MSPLHSAMLPLKLPYGLAAVPLSVLCHAKSVLPGVTPKSAPKLKEKLCSHQLAFCDYLRRLTCGAGTQARFALVYCRCPLVGSEVLKLVL